VGSYLSNGPHHAQPNCTCAVVVKYGGRSFLQNAHLVVIMFYNVPSRNIETLRNLKLCFIICTQI
jgi:hypothetical protein